ncbi:trichohyalin [Biomphalaria pfeifferi]|uniref:Trichohyalin n=1 Tax=Biomphalaria pfeifferi TaxID=112525 RepID=A0AAD8C223_BIOPF|nr:trichohyalin [Biomphalaria pfeifferi]
MKVSYHKLIFAIICLIFSLDCIESAAVAKNEYYMDLRADCLSTGFLDVPRDQTVYVNARSTGTVNNQQLTCYLQFNPQTDGDTLKMWVESGSYISDCDVSLEMSMNDEKYIYGCQSSQNSLPNYQTINGKGTLRLIRKSYGDLDFGFKIGIKATKSMAAVTPGDSSSGNVGMIVGIVVGIIVAIVIATVVCVCCYRKRHNNDTKNGGLLSKNALSASSTCTFDNTGAKNGGLEFPGSDRKLLGKDGIDYENEDRLKPKSALERFGPSPPKNQKASENVSEVKRREPELRQIPVPTARVIPNISQRNKKESQGKNANIPAPPPIEALLSRQSSTVTSSSETMGERNSGSPGDRNSQGNNTIFAALRNNPKFRKSFRENEADAEDRAQRISSYTSTSSMASDTSKPQLPLLPSTNSAKPELKKPQLPPVPKLRPRPSSPERRGEIAAIHRHRPSSSTSESSRLDAGKGDENVKSQKMKSTEASKSLPKKDGRRNNHSSDSEESEQSRRHRHRSKDRDKEPKRKQHADRRSRSNSKKKYHSDSEDSESSRGKSRPRHRSEDRDKDPKRRQHNERQGRKKSKDDFSSESEVSEIYKDIRSKSRGNTVDREDKRKQKPEEPSASEEKRDRDYERKFVKSTGVRKSKGKGVHRMNRSKSTGSALEELESNYSQSKSAGSVKSLNLNFIDEDIDLDSNLQPFKRAGSKQSLYASRSSLYGRRRKNSMGETISLSSYMYDDVESRMSDFDRASISTKDKARMFKSTGDLDLNMQTVKIVRDCSTWTGSSKCVEVFEKRPLTRGRHDKRYNRGTQTSSHKERNNSLASEASVHSTHRLKSRSKSQESLGSDKRRRTHKNDDRNKSPHHSKSDLRSKDGRSRAKSTDSDSTHYTVDSSDSGNTQHSTHNFKAKPKPKQRNLTVDDDLESVISAAPSAAYIPYQPATNPQYIPVNYPVAPYPQPYLAPVPNAVPFVAPNVVMQKPAIAPKPVTQAPQSGGTKWDQLVNLTEGMKKRRHQMGESINETESVMSSAWSEFTPQVYVQDPNRTYSTSYPESSGPVPQYGYYHAPPSESNI